MHLCLTCTTTSLTSRCLQAQQTGNFEMAVQSLHQFFDYCMSMHDQALYQYALLNLAILHARFGHFDQARFVLFSFFSHVVVVNPQELESYHVLLIIGYPRNGGSGTRQHGPRVFELCSEVRASFMSTPKYEPLVTNDNTPLFGNSWHDRLTGTGATSSAEMNEARNMAGQPEGQSFHYLQSLGELIKSRQLVSAFSDLAPSPIQVGDRR